ncbi:glycoside hydrolase family 43 protein [Nesterenkonia haasae]|uniref:glycoside hydrolase family 43 protein n=1 Tax=Nesterenkonia haasae TaxID=2587813 RepID=UPI0013911365|nr:glycoside hydrolase family 43 protein [Nesterenkonia haasae]NDK30993.1 glycoside hydrolase family 43 protein [Nesterenkonia haasae]
MVYVENPILPGCYPDPSICRVGEYYYLVTSTFEVFPALPLFRSRDLVTWEQIGHAIDRPDQMSFDGVKSSQGIFAPTIRHYDGVFYLVCTLVGTPEGTPGGNFLITATDPAESWSDPIWLDADGIDPSIFFDTDGTVWIHGTRLAEDPEWRQQTEVWLRQYDPQQEVLRGPETVIWTGALKGGIWAEAPHLFRKDGEYFLLAAEGGTAHHHSVMIAKSDNLTGPYRGNPGNPILTHRHLGRHCDVVGAGHADLVEASDGTWWAVLLGMRTYGGYHYNLGRETFLTPVVWEDGWPIFAPGEGRVPHRVYVPGAEARESAPPLSGVIPPGDQRWTALRGPIDSFAQPVGEGWEIAVRPTRITEPSTPAFLGVRQQHMDVDITAKVITDQLEAGERTGLLIRQSESDHATVEIHRGHHGDTARVTHRQAGQHSILHEEPVEASQKVTLGLRARGQDYQLTINGASIGSIDGRLLDTVSTGGFLGLWIGVFATSDGAATTSTVTLTSFEYTAR